jgi:hypothetical protein
MLITFTIARLIATALLLWALAPNPPDYYQLLRFAVAAISVLGVYCANRWNSHFWILAFAWLAILFNPIYTVSLPKSAWTIIDIAAAAFMVASLFFVKPNRERVAEPGSLKTS